MARFREYSPIPTDVWRSIILFGRNVATYKFALGKSIIEFAAAGKEFLPLEELAAPFARHLCEHLKSANKQGTFSTSQFLDALRQFNEGSLDHDGLIKTTVSKGFNNVIDAFHTVGQQETPCRFFVDERRGQTPGIRLTDELFALPQQFQFQNLPGELEARWRLVETAWELNMPARALTVSYSPEDEKLVVPFDEQRRTSLTGCREALNGYQNGKCFYSFEEISIGPNSERMADIDHFFPHVLKDTRFGHLIDGVWNLVLSSRICNRGESGKFERIPEVRYLERLHQRNEYLILSHHPLRETLMRQTGNAEPERHAFLQNVYDTARSLLPPWEPPFEYPGRF